MKSMVRYENKSRKFVFSGSKIDWMRVRLFFLSPPGLSAVLFYISINSVAAHPKKFSLRPPKQGPAQAYFPSPAEDKSNRLRRSIATKTAKLR